MLTETQKGIRNDALVLHYGRLRAAKIPVVKHDDHLIGTHKGEPYIVFCKFIQHHSDYAMVVLTRYKGKDWGLLAPTELLQREGGK